MNRRDVLLTTGSVFFGGCLSRRQTAQARDDSRKSPTDSENAQFGTETPTATPTPRPQPYIEGERGVVGKVVKNSINGLELELYRAKFYEDQGFFNVGMHAINSTESTITNVQAVCRFYGDQKELGTQPTNISEVPAGKEVNVEFLLRDHLEKLENFTVSVGRP